MGQDAGNKELTEAVLRAGMERARVAQTGPTVSAVPFVLVASALAYLAFAGGDVGVPAMARGILFSLSAICGLIGILLFIGAGPYFSVAQRLGFAMTALSDATGWAWEPTAVNSEGHPLSTGRVTGQAAEVDFVWECKAGARRLALHMPPAGPAKAGLRDFADLEADTALARWRRSPDAYPEALALLGRKVAAGFGRDRQLTVDGDRVVISCTPYKEKRLSADANVARRVREVAAVQAFAAAAVRDRRAALAREAAPEAPR